MHTEQDKLGFSKRLKAALELAGSDSLSLSEIANRFNLRHPNNPITPQAVHNWLIGQSIPTPDKIATLSKWLNVSPDWLRYGKEETEGQKLTSEELLLLKYFRCLTAKQQQCIIAMLNEFQK
ncbi:helix-turn-helix domain-containing protein [Caviibacterium pharyngocola]|uniref:Transcriptional regulator n=1 Tax=Caviibacterium pharyngocola TaxID=28159 RepID=A0A2M8RXP3_9PAST|nr:helix-turn-helix domain-containing protein [Caviibacterium pharyngocola]PJG83659.1 transcriptional regulator [Caviibacterium pharyngocola]